MKIFLFALLFAWSALTSGVGSVDNPDKPAKGTWDFQPQKLWETPGIGKDTFTSGARPVRVSQTGDVYIFDSKLTKFLVFDQDGKPLRAFGNAGEGPGEIKGLISFFLKGDKLVAADNGRISYFDLTGKFLEDFPTERGMFPVSFLDEYRFLYNTMIPRNPGDKPKLNIYDMKQKKVQSLAEFEFSQEGTASQGGMRVVMRIPQLTPMPVVGVGAGRICFGHNDQYAMKIVDFQGKQLAGFTLDRQATPISDAEKKKILSAGSGGGPQIRINRGGGSGGASTSTAADDMLNTIIKSLPDKLTLFSRIDVDERGYIYGFVTEKNLDQGQRIDIFSPEGKYLYKTRVIPPEGETIMNNNIYFNDSHLFLVCENEDGDIRLMKFRIAQPR